jgi:hypothetical protein
VCHGDDVFVVAITRWARPLEEELVELAAIVGEVPYDLRLRLAGTLPAIFGRTSDRQEAIERLGMLRGRGHGAVACDVDRVPRVKRCCRPATTSSRPTPSSP